MQKNRDNADSAALVQNRNKDKDRTQSELKNSAMAKEAEIKELGLADAAGRVLSNHNDPLNKTLRGIAEHISSGLNNKQTSLQQDQELSKAMEVSQDENSFEI